MEGWSQMSLPPSGPLTCQSADKSEDREAKQMFYSRIIAQLNIAFFFSFFLSINLFLLITDLLNHTEIRLITETEVETDSDRWRGNVCLVLQQEEKSWLQGTTLRPRTLEKCIWFYKDRMRNYSINLCLNHLHIYIHCLSKT